MNVPVTIIGASPAQGPAPTRLGDAGVRPGFVPTAMPGSAPAAEGPSNSTSAARVGYQPTALRTVPPPAQKAERTKSYAPTALKPGTPLPASATAEPLQASALPGVQRKALAVPMVDLARRFPQASALALQRAQGMLTGIHLESMGPAGWLSFGLEVQEELSMLVKQRLALAQSPAARAAPQHLSRLHTLLSDVLEALDGGFMKKSPERVWAECQGEVAQLEQLLDRVGDALVEQLREMSALKAPAHACGERLEASALAAEYLIDRVATDAGGLLVARLASLASSLGMLREHVLYLEQGLTNLQELLTHVQNGVLLKLPAVYSQLAALTGKPTQTQRFLATEQLNEILQTITQRKNT